MTTSLTSLAPWGRSFPPVTLPTIVDKFFESFDSDFFDSRGGYPYDVVVYKDNENNYTKRTELVYALAGVREEDIKISVEDSTLIVEVDTENYNYNSEDESAVVVHKGISTRSLKHKFALSNVDSDNISSTFKNGILTISVPSKKKDVRYISVK